MTIIKNAYDSILWGEPARGLQRLLLALGVFCMGCGPVSVEAKNKHNVPRDSAAVAGLFANLSVVSVKSGTARVRLRLENKKYPLQEVSLKLKTTPANATEILQLRSMPRQLKWKKPHPTALHATRIPTLRKGQKLNVTISVRLHKAGAAWVKVQIAFSHKKRQVATWLSARFVREKRRAHQARKKPQHRSLAKPVKAPKKALLGFVGKPSGLLVAKGFGGDDGDKLGSRITLSLKRTVGPVNKKGVQSALAGRKIALERCYLTILTDWYLTPKGSLPKGTARLAFWIKASGELGRIEVMKGSWRPAKLLSCLRRVSKKLRYPQARGRKPYKFVVWMRFRTRY